MPRVSIANGPGNIHERMYRQLRPELEGPAKSMTDACYHSSILPWRIREGVRFRIALINGCLLCQADSSRTPAALQAGFSDDMYQALIAGTWRDSGAFSPGEKVAIEFAERFALDHDSIDDGFWTRLNEHFSDPEILDLTFFTARFMGFGRLTHVLGLDDSCAIAPSTSEPVAASSTSA